MAFIDRHGPGDRGDATFECALLDSARADGPPSGAAKDAWAKFAIETSAVTTVATARGGHASLVRAVRGSAVKWLALGVISGSGLTAMWMNARYRSNGSPPAVVGSANSASASASSPAYRASARGIEGPPNLPDSTAFPDGNSPPDRSGKPSWKASSNPFTRHQRRGVASGARGEELAVGKDLSTLPRPPEEIRPGDPTATLAAEVALLDEARNTLAAGDLEQVLRLVDHYREEFPSGQLAPDADVVAIEALAALGDRAQVTLRAKRFLDFYPRDPHVARIRSLAEH